MQIEYCEGCNGRITERDQEVGNAAWVDGRLLCKKCMAEKGLEPSPRTVPVAGMPKKESGSGIHRVPGVGSGIHNIPMTPPRPGKIRPPSGLFVGNSGGTSSARRGRTSQVRAARSTAKRPSGSGVRGAAARSGIRQVDQDQDQPSPTSSRLRQARRRSSGAWRAAGRGSTLWVPLVGVIVGLLAGAVLFLLWQNN
ncbi:MAG: hypothetical protein M5U26_00010 [Planctomycetota bacterium]|nr:hypothetical protein [Planctomycetota bacterium]